MATSMKTLKLYQQDVTLQVCEANVISCEKDKNSILLEFDQTVFFPAGGGQSCDFGQIFLSDENGQFSGLPFDIVDVFETEGRILHRISPESLSNIKPAPISAHSSFASAKNSLSNVQKHEVSMQTIHAAFTPGRSVLQKLNWKHRFDNMQRHCGEHILSGIFYREFGGVNRGFHMGNDSMTIDISFEKDSKYHTLTWQMAKHAELCANEVIWQNIPIITHHFNSRKEAEKLPLRKALAFDEDITIVCIGNPENAADCVACCGTHPTSTGQVGLIKIWKIEPNKGMFRIYFEAGKRAYLDYEKKHDILTTIGAHYSAGVDDLLDKINTAEEKTKALRSELHSMRKIIIDNRIADIKAALANNAHDDTQFLKNQVLSSNSNIQSKYNTSGSPLLVFCYSDLNPSDIMHIGKPFIGKTEKLLILADAITHTALLFSNGTDYDCGKLVKENAPIYQGKGGGKADNARAVFTSEESLETFIDLLSKHLR